MNLPPFPVDDVSLDLLEQAMTIEPGAESASIFPTLDMFSALGGSDLNVVEEQVSEDIRVMRDPVYHPDDVIRALIAEVRRLRGQND